MGRVLAFGVATALAIVAACTAYEEAPPEAVPAGDASSEASSDATAGDGALPSGMVVVETAAARFAIDSREVTVKDWKSFRDTHSYDGSTLPAECAWKQGYGPNTAACPYDDIDTFPMHCVDWCDAHAYCTAVGKRLCGKIGGGAVARNDQTNPSLDQWTRACANGLDGNRWSYGPTLKPSACNTDTFDGGREGGFTAPGSLPECQGGVPGLFDMSGNVWEWEDATCLASDAGRNSDECRIRGGSYGSSDLNAKCNNTYPKNRAHTERVLGFRCCKDL